MPQIRIVVGLWLQELRLHQITRKKEGQDAGGAGWWGAACGRGIYCTAKQQSAKCHGSDTGEQNKTEISITDDCLEGRGSNFVINVAFQPGRQRRLHYLTNASGNIKGKIKLVNE